MNTQVERPNTAAQGKCQESTIKYLVAGLGVGAALSVFLAPKSGEETRKWIAGKCLNAIDATNKRVERSRAQLRKILDQGQQQIDEVVATGRKAMVTPKAAESVGATPATPAHV